MRAISLWQPWASAVVIGSKQIETRHWSTNYRGPLLIHAAKRAPVGEMIQLGSSWTWCGVMGRSMGSFNPIRELPFGAIVGRVDLVDCQPTDTFTVAELDERRRRGTSDDIYTWTERMLGNFAPGRFGWVFANPVQFDRPLTWRGRQQFFDVPDTVVLGHFGAAALKVIDLMQELKKSLAKAKR